MPLLFWPDAFRCAVYLHNRLPQRRRGTRQNKSPYERWIGIAPDVSHVKVFGCLAYAHVLDKNRSKLDVKAEECRFLGYDDQRKSYLLWNIHRRTYFHSRDIVVDENSFQSVNGEFQTASFPTTTTPMFLPSSQLRPNRWRSLIPDPPPVHTIALGKRPRQPKAPLQSQATQT
jgi:hypothetical protein